MNCSHCNTSNATNRWTPQLCADGRKKRSKYLCDPCDVELNRLMLEFFNDPRAAEKMRAYQSTERNQ